MLEGLFLTPQLVSLFDRVMSCLERIKEFRALMQGILVDTRHGRIENSKLIQLRQGEKQFDEDLGHLLRLLGQQDRFRSLETALTYNFY